MDSRGAMDADESRGARGYAATYQSLSWEAARWAGILDCGCPTLPDQGSVG